MKIGYQGTEGSFSEIAAEKLIERESLTNCELIPLASSENVCKGLEDGNIDFGVVAVENSIGGEVFETKKAFQSREIHQISSVAIPISQCLFKKTRQIKDNDLHFVASHQQALMQCKDTLQNILKDYQTVTVEDTALAAKRLANGVYEENTAVICSLKAGQINNLVLVQDNIQDSSGNTTYFKLIRLKQKSTQSFTTRITRVFSVLISSIFLKYFLQSVFTVLIIIAFYLSSLLDLSPLKTVLSIGGPFVGLSLLLTSKKIRNWINLKRIIGYWSYYVTPHNSETSTPKVNQLEGLKRVAVISLENNNISIKGWLCDSPVKMLFESNHALVSNPEYKTGIFMYKYVSSTNAPTGVNFNGMVSLEFFTNSVFEKIEKMSGWYVNREGDMGHLVYNRISKDEFDLWTKNEM